MCREIQFHKFLSPADPRIDLSFQPIFYPQTGQIGQGCSENPVFSSQRFFRLEHEIQQMARGHAPPHVTDTTRAVGEGASAVPFILSQNPPLFREFRGQAARRSPLTTAKGISAVVGHFLNRQPLFFQQLPNRQLKRALQTGERRDHAR